MRNFGNESYVSAHQHHQQQQQQLFYHHFHHQLVPPSVSSIPSIHHQLATIPPAVKLEPYPLAKPPTSSGVSTANLKLPAKSHFSPVTLVAPHDPHYATAPNSNGPPANTANNNSSGIPINLSHPPHPSLLQGTTTTPSAESHLPTLTATCPGNRPPSPARPQQIPVSSPYHPPHSPALSIANTPLPSEVAVPSLNPASAANRSSPPSSMAQINPVAAATTTSATADAKPLPHLPHHLATVTSFNKIQYHNNLINSKISKASEGGGGPTAATTDPVPSHSLNPSNPLSGSHLLPSSEVVPVKSDATPSHPAPLANNNNNGVVNGSNGNSPMSCAGSNSPPVGNGSSTVTTATTASASTARIVSQNVNGTLSITGIPSNESELQLFRVLQRANLLSYFDMMIELGGDDVQQLCEAGEEEFLEIMALIGMASKPLHVRRLQKALQEWMTQPSLFQSPVLPPGYQHHYGVSQIEQTISHTQYSATNAPGGIAHSHPHSAAIHHPHLLSHNPVSPFPAQSAPATPASTPFAIESSADSSSLKGEPLKKPPSLGQERGSNNGSPSLAGAGTTGTGVGGLHGPYLQQPLIPVVISTNGQTYNSGQAQQQLHHPHHQQQQSQAESFRSCVSPSGSTSSSNSSSSTVSIRSHHLHPHQQPHPFHQNYPSSPMMEHSPSSPANSESSGRSSSSGGSSASRAKSRKNRYLSHHHHRDSHQKHPQSDEMSTSAELEIGFNSSADQTNCVQSQENSAGTGRVASPPTAISSFLKATIPTSSSTATQRADSPRSSFESVTNRNNNSVSFTASQPPPDFSSLQEHEIQKLAETAMNLVRSLPPTVREPKLSRKIETSSYEFILRLSDDDPRKMEEIRKLSTIFGKPNGNGAEATAAVSKRSKHANGTSNNNATSNSYSKPVSILELSMNEAAAQLCLLVPALLTKRDEMYNLARQVIRESGLPYAVICANSNLPSSFLHNSYNTTTNNNNNNNNEGFKGKLDERNSPAHEDRISHQFAAACKKIKLTESQDSNGSRKNSQDNGVNGGEVHSNPPTRRKSPSRESNIVTATALKRMASLTSEYRHSQNKAAQPIRT